MQETWVLSLDWEDPLEKEIATHSSILAWEISGTDEPDGPQSMGHKRVERDWVTKQQQPHISAIMWYFYFTSLSMTISRSTHVSANCITSFFLHPLYICITSSLSIHLLMDIYMAPMSWLLWIVLLWCRRVHESFWIIVLSRYIPGVGLLDHMATLLVFWGTSILFSIVAAPIYIPINSVGRLPFPHTLSIICYL